jgi:hypothetical protein
MEGDCHNAHLDNRIKIVDTPDSFSKRPLHTFLNLIESRYLLPLTAGGRDRGSGSVSIRLERSPALLRVAVTALQETFLCGLSSPAAEACACCALYTTSTSQQLLTQGAPAIWSPFPCRSFSAEPSEHSGLYRPPWSLSSWCWCSAIMRVWYAISALRCSCKMRSDVGMRANASKLNPYFLVQALNQASTGPS